MRTKKVAARVCTRRAPSHTVQSCVSGPFGALEPNGAYSGGAPHPRWRQVNLDSISDLRRCARPGREAGLSDGATRCAAAHHALDHRPATAVAPAPPPHRRRTAPYHESAGLHASPARVSQRPSVGGAHPSSPRFHMGARTSAGQISAGLPVTRGTSVFGART